MENNAAYNSQENEWRIEVFGELRLLRDGDVVRFRFPTRKTAALLAYLAINRTPQSYQRLIDEFWPDGASLGSLHHALSVLRKLLEPPGTRRGRILKSNPAVSLVGSVATDVADFEGARRAAKEAREPAVKIAALSRMAELYQGELLLGYDGPWFNVQREHWHRILQGNLRQLIVLLEDAGRWEEALCQAQRALDLAPRSETAWDDVIRVLHVSGQTDEARRQCGKLLDQLRQKQLEPSPVTRDLAAGLLSRAGQTTKTGAPNHPSHTSAELSPADPGLPPARPGDLPTYPAPFFGRADAVSEIRLRLLAPGPKWVTLTGLGGVGKTRLAREAAIQMPPPYAGARTFVSLTHIGAPDLILPAVAEALRLPRTGQGEPLEAVVTALGERPSLLILDNLEHLAAAGGALVETLILRVPDLAVLVTSRVALGHKHEQLVPVEALPTPLPSDPAELFYEYDSVKLFADHARLARPSFQITIGNIQAVAHLCRALEGIPLALELAAARSLSLEPAQMLSHLSQRFALLVREEATEQETLSAAASGDRHRSLWATIEWSYRLLPADLQRFFTRLTAFQGGWTADHAKAVAAEPLAEEYLEELKRQSLVTRTVGPGRRFHMLETLREYGAAQLSPQEQEALSATHRDYFLALAGRARDGLVGPRQSRWLERLDQEHANLRAALRWCSTKPRSEASVEEDGGEEKTIREDRAEGGLRLAERLWEFWNLHAYWSEGRHWLDLFLERTAGAGTTADRAAAYNGSGVLAIQQGDYVRAREHLLISLAMAHLLGPKQEGDVLSSLAYLASKPDNVLAVPAEATSEVILAKYHRAMREQPDQARRAEIATFWPLLGQGKHEMDLGNRTAAASYFAESLKVCEKFEDKQGMSHPLTFLAQIAREQGKWEMAHDYLRRGLRLRQELKDMAGIAVFLEQFGELARAQQHWERCVLLYGAAWAVRGLAEALAPEGFREYQRRTDPAGAMLGPAAFKELWHEGISMTREKALIFSDEA